VSERPRLSPSEVKRSVLLAAGFTEAEIDEIDLPNLTGETMVHLIKTKIAAPIVQMCYDEITVSLIFRAGGHSIKLVNRIVEELTSTLETYEGVQVDHVGLGIKDEPGR